MNESAISRAWWYNCEGKQLGPAGGEELIRLIRARKVTAQTSVWREDQEGWKAAGETELGEVIKAHGPALPPPMPAGPPPMPVEPNAAERLWEQVRGRDRFAWGILLVLGTSILIEYATGWTTFSALFAIAGNVACLVLDRNHLRKMGLAQPGAMWTLIVPVYLWKRGGLLKDMRLYLAAWTLLFCVNLYAGYAGQQREAMIETSKALVEEIINRNNYQRAAGGPVWTVRTLKIIRKTGENEYRAIAVSSVGKTYQVDIQVLGDEVLVSVNAL